MSADRVAGGAELALLVVLAVLGQVALRDHAQHAAAVDDDGGVEQAVLGLSGAPTTITGPQRPLSAAIGQSPRAPRPGQRLLVQEVVDRVPGKPEFGESDERGVSSEARRASSSVRSALNAGSAIRTVRDGRGHADEAVAVERVKSVVHRDFTLATSGPGRCNCPRVAPRICSFPARDRTPA